MTLIPSNRLAIRAVLIATIVGFMGIGLVDPILVSISQGLHATPSQVSLLFSSYFFITAIMMLATDYTANHLGLKRTMVLGSIAISLFALACGTATTVYQLIGYRSGWGLGNALFVATALTLLVTLSHDSRARPIKYYEAALGAGIACGPLLGAALGQMSWRYPFVGTAVLMLVAGGAITKWVPRTPSQRHPGRGLVALKALRTPYLLYISVAAFFYNFVFFTILAYAPFVLHLDVVSVGLVFFGWGLALAITSTIVTTKWKMHQTPKTILTVCLVVLFILMLLMAWLVRSTVPQRGWLSAGVILCGAWFGVVNTLFTELALETPNCDTSVSSAAYNFIRWLGGAIAPFIITTLGEHYGAEWSFALAAVFAIIALLVVKRIPQPQ